MDLAMGFGLDALGRALERLQGADTPEVAWASAGEVLLWVVALDETRGAASDRQTYRTTRDRDRNGQLLPALRWARNSVVHELKQLVSLVDVIWVGESTAEDQQLDHGGPVPFWPWLDSLSIVEPQGRRRDELLRWHEGRAAYVEHLEGRPMLRRFERAAHFLQHGPHPEVGA